MGHRALMHECHYAPTRLEGAAMPIDTHARVLLRVECTCVAGGSCLAKIVDVHEIEHAVNCLGFGPIIPSEVRQLALPALLP